jgi:hypothetical protein
MVATAVEPRPLRQPHVSSPTPKQPPTVRSWRVLLWAQLFLLWGTALGKAAGARPPLSPFAANPRYFHFRGRATTLVSDGEHYGALINADYDYRAYFAALGAKNFTLTETFSGTYVEPDSDCDASGEFPLDNTLSPLNVSCGRSRYCTTAAAVLL